jgi:hypothetical protein
MGALAVELAPELAAQDHLPNRLGGLGAARLVAFRRCQPLQPNRQPAHLDVMQAVDASLRPFISDEAARGRALADIEQSIGPILDALKTKHAEAGARWRKEYAILWDGLAIIARGCVDPAGRANAALKHLQAKARLESAALSAALQKDDDEDPS